MTEERRLPETLQEHITELTELANHGATYEQRLIMNVGSTEDAARVDLAIDGRLAYVDLRRRPFAGNPQLKSLYREAREALEDLTGALIALAWKEPNR